MPVDGAQAPCSGCSEIVHVVPSSGVLRRKMAMEVHALAVSDQAYHQRRLQSLPLQWPPPSLLDKGMCLSHFSDSPSSPDGEGSIFDFPKITKRLLKRIPNACRLGAAIAFEKCLRLVYFQ